MVVCAFTLRVCGSQSSAPPHNLEVDYDFNDFLFQFRAGAALPWFGRENMLEIFISMAIREKISFVKAKHMPVNERDYSANGVEGGG